MSGRKNTLKRFKIVSAGDMSAPITSSPTNIEFLDNVAIQLNASGTPTGTFEVQVSIDYEQDAQGNITDVGNWVPLTLSPPPVTVGAPVSILIDVNQTSTRWVRTVYTPTAGTGVLNAYISAKMI